MEIYCNIWKKMGEYNETFWTVQMADWCIWELRVLEAKLKDLSRRVGSEVKRADGFYQTWHMLILMEVLLKNWQGALMPLANNIEAKTLEMLFTNRRLMKRIYRTIDSLKRKPPGYWICSSTSLMLREISRHEDFSITINPRKGWLLMLMNTNTFIFFKFL